MKTIIKRALVVGIAIFMGSVGIAQAGSMDWHSQNWKQTATSYTAHQQYQKYIDNLSDEQRHQLERFLEYEYDRDESCEGYVQPPAGFKVIKCKLHYPVAGEMVPVPKKVVVIGDVIKSYEIHFAYDSYALEPEAVQTLNELALDIKKYDPRQVTVAGHTDTAGPADYNAKLSEKRAEAVADALNKRDISAMVLDKESYGESMPAVNTGDGVALRKNRRVVIDFRK